MMALLLALLAMVFVARSAHTVAPEQRGVVLRFGRHQAYAEPGLHFIVPFIDRMHRVQLEDEVPGWRALDEAQLRDAVLARVFGAGLGRP